MNDSSHCELRSISATVGKTEVLLAHIKILLFATLYKVISFGFSKKNYKCCPFCRPTDNWCFSKNYKIAAQGSSTFNAIFNIFNYIYYILNFWQYYLVLRSLKDFGRQNFPIKAKINQNLAAEFHAAVVLVPKLRPSKSTNCVGPLSCEFAIFLKTVWLHQIFVGQKGPLLQFFLKNPGKYYMRIGVSWDNFIVKTLIELRSAPLANQKYHIVFGPTKCVEINFPHCARVHLNYSQSLQFKNTGSTRTNSMAAIFI